MPVAFRWFCCCTALTTASVLEPNCPVPVNGAPRARIRSCQVLIVALWSPSEKYCEAVHFGAAALAGAGFGAGLGFGAGFGFGVGFGADLAGVLLRYLPVQARSQVLGPSCPLPGRPFCFCTALTTASVFAPNWPVPVSGAPR